MNRFGLAIAAALCAGPVMAQDSVLWKNVGDWEISVDPTIADGCYAVGSWSGGTELRIGKNPQKDNFYLWIWNEKWSSLQPETDYDIEIKFGSRASWEVSARGLQFKPGEIVYLHAQSSKTEFLREFQKAVNMRISYEGSEIDNLKLTGSSRAWDEVEACQKAVAARAKPDDPFASGGVSGGSPASPSGSGRKAVDPFASN